MTIKNVIFDFGNVLFRWDPKVLYRKIFDDEQEIDYFLENICTPHIWNLQADAGCSLAVITKELVAEYPHYKMQIEAFYDRWEEMLTGEVDGSVDILRELHDKNIPLYGLTNWSAELFPVAQRRFDCLGLFNDIVVSGSEKTAKPEADIYHILLKRNNLDPKTCLFIDDRQDNIDTGESLHIKGHLFTDAPSLRADLVLHNIL